MLFANLVFFLEFLYISDKIGSTFYHVSSLKSWTEYKESLAKMQKLFYHKEVLEVFRV